VIYWTGMSGELMVICRSCGHTKIVAVVDVVPSL
jgi:hypothetical protein